MLLHIGIFILNVLFFVVPVAAGIAIAKEREKKGHDFSSDVLVAFAAGAVVGLILMMVFSSYMVRPLTSERYVSSSMRLHNLYEDSESRGSFFLGSGSINQIEYLFYNGITENDLINPEKMEKYNSDVYIAEDGAGNPRLERVCSRSAPYYKNEFDETYGFKERDCIYIFHIPQGSVDSGYKVK